MGKKILLADDSITIQKVISLSFASEDYELIIVGDGNSAVEKAKETTPDLILADIAMPGKTGYEVCEAVKQDPALSTIPVMLLAGTFEPLDDAEAKRVGANDHIVKPFESEELLNKVTALLMGAPAAAQPPAAAPAPPAATPAPPAAAPTPPPSATDAIWETGDFAEPAAPAEPPAAPAPAATEAPEEVAADDFFDLDLSDEQPAAAPAAEAAVAPPPAPEAPPMAPPEPAPMAPPEPAPMAPPEPAPMAAPPAAAPAPEPFAAPEPAPMAAPPAAPPAPEAPMAAPEPGPFAAPPAAAPEAPPTGAGAALGSMSKEEILAMVDKIARDVIEEVVWEVVPELAEELLRTELIDKVRKAMAKPE